MGNGSALDLHVGAFARDIDDLHSNFSFYLVPKKNPNIQINTMKIMMLKFKVSHGQGLSDKYFVESTKQGIRVPNNIDELKCQVEILQANQVFSSVLHRNLLLTCSSFETK